jgi:hypothetical protein
MSNTLAPEFHKALLADLAPQGALEHVYAHEIAAATERLHLCGLKESCIPESIDPAADPLRRSLERSRAAAHNVIAKCLKQLRMLQTERQVRAKLFGQNIPEGLGLADCEKVTKLIAAHEKQREAEKQRVAPDAPKETPTPKTAVATQTATAPTPPITAPPLTAAA